MRELVTRIHIDQEILDEIRDRLDTKSEDAKRLLELYDTLDEAVEILEEDVKYYKGRDISENANLLEKWRVLTSLLRLKADILREFRYLVRPEPEFRARIDNANGHETNQRRDNEGITPKEVKSRERAANFAKNRQHKNRVAIGHEGVSSES